MADTYYTEDHEWVRVTGDVARIGITSYAAEQLGDIVFVELPESGRAAKQGEDVAVVESVKSASEIYAPVTGEITACNEELESAPETVNEDAIGKGWFFEMKLASKDELTALMSAEAYASFVEGL